MEFNKNKERLTNVSLGIGFLALSAVIIYVASQGKGVEEQDATPILLFIPIGLELIFNNRKG